MHVKIYLQEKFPLERKRREGRTPADLPGTLLPAADSKSGGAMCILDNFWRYNDPDTIFR